MIEERALVDSYAQHLFEADRLSAKLGFIALARFRPPPFVFDRKRFPPSSNIRESDGHIVRAIILLHTMELDDVRFPCKAEAKTPDSKPAHDSYVASVFSPFLVDPIMEQFSLSRESVIFPLLFEMNESALSFAEEEVLNRRERQEIVLGIHRLI